MRRILTLASVVALFGVLGTGTAVAQDTGNACPPASPAGEGESPPCGSNGNGNGNGEGNGGGNGNGRPGDVVCPPNSPNAGDPPPCGPGDDGDNGDGDNGDGDNGNGDATEQCEQADLVVLDGAELVCVYLGDNTENAEGDCDGAIEVPVEGLVTLCILPSDAEGAPSPDDIGEVPALPGTLPGL